MQVITYNDIAALHGKKTAYSTLRVLETVAQIRDEIISLDMETRFQNALKAICEIDFAS